MMLPFEFSKSAPEQSYTLKCGHTVDRASELKVPIEIYSNGRSAAYTGYKFCAACLGEFLSKKFPAEM